MTRYAIDNHERLLRVVCILLAVAILAVKVPLIWRININWDEFYFLSHVHSLARGDLAIVLQGAYSHLFIWLTRLDADEIGQIHVARSSMWPLLVLSGYLLFRLARRWASATGAWFAVFAFVASGPVMVHGASFRADSLLLALTLAILLLASDSARVARWRDIGAGFLFGVAFALTIKVMLLLPALVAVLLCRGTDDREDHGQSDHRFLPRIMLIAVAGGLTAALILATHATFIAAAAEQPAMHTIGALGSALFDVSWVPRWILFKQLLANDKITWILLAAGFLVAILRRQYGAAACALTLLPILFYRNAFPYYYVVMLAPACVVIAVAIDEIRRFAAGTGRAAAGSVAIALLFLLIARDAKDHVMTLRFDEQAAQQSVISAVHRIFPSPVPYIDHSGMIASFPKVNFFMSSWGVESYVAGGKDFMPALLAAHRPPLLLANHFSLVPRSLMFRKLSPTDQALIRDSYVDYWGPVRVAGTELIIQPGGISSARPPFTGLYRIESAAPILINGQRYDSGDVMRWDAVSPDLRVQAASPDSGPLRVRIIWAAAKAPPKERPPTRPLYLGL